MIKEVDIRKFCAFLAACYAPMKSAHLTVAFFKSFDPNILKMFFLTFSFAAFLVGGVVVAVGILRKSPWAWWIGFIVSSYQLYIRAEMLYSDFKNVYFAPFFPLGFTTLWLAVFIIALLHPSIRGDIFTRHATIKAS